MIVKMDSSGRILLLEQIRSELQLGAPASFVVDVVDGSIRLVHCDESKLVESDGFLLVDSGDSPTVENVREWRMQAQR